MPVPDNSVIDDNIPTELHFPTPSATPQSPPNRAFEYVRTESWQLRRARAQQLARTAMASRADASPSSPPATASARSLSDIAPANGANSSVHAHAHANVNAHPPDTPGAPWRREGAAHEAPQTPLNRQRAERIAEAEAQREARQKRRAERRAEREREKLRLEKEAEKHLEQVARRLYFLGFFALPLVWIVVIIYFRREHKSQDANENIKRYFKNARIMLIVYSLLFFAWFVLFQVFANSALRPVNILYMRGTSPNGI